MMRFAFILFVALPFEIVTAAEIGVEKNCSDDSKSLIVSAWETYPRDRRARQGDPDVSLKLLEKAIEKSPECQWALRHLSSLNIEMNYIDQAKKYNKILLEKYPTDPVAKDDKSELLALDGKYQEAIKLLEEIINENGAGNGAWYYSLAMVYALQNKNEKALDYLEMSAAISAGWLNEENAQAESTFAKVIKEERFGVLLHKYLHTPNQSLKSGTPQGGAP